MKCHVHKIKVVDGRCDRCDEYAEALSDSGLVECKLERILVTEEWCSECSYRRENSHGKCIEQV